MGRQAARSEEPPVPARHVARVRAIAAAIAFSALLAACSGSAGSPSASVSVPAESRSPAPAASPTAVPQTASPPSATVAGETGGPYAEALVARLAEEPFIAHVDQLADITATSAAGEVTVSAGMSADMSGDDVSFVLDIEVAGQRQTQEIRVVGDTAYLKQADGTWSGLPRDALGDTLDGLVDNIRIVDDPDDLRYVGLETKDGRELHHLTGAGAIPYTPATGGTGQYDTLEVWMEEDGTPVRVEGTFTATDANGVEGRGSTEFEFSRFGGPIDIEPPPIEPPAS
jgi:hypothetical protein